jgi:diguanylate cyclase (GGDEF)-like protein
MLRQIETMLGVGVWHACAEKQTALWSQNTNDILKIDHQSDRGQLKQMLVNLSDDDQKTIETIILQVSQDGQNRSHSCISRSTEDGDSQILFEIAKNTDASHFTWPIIGIVKIDSDSQNVAKMRRIACYDSLTGLPNHLLFREQLSYAVRVGKRERTIVAVLTIEIGDLRRISDAYGRTVSDHIIKTVASRLNNSVRAGDSVAVSEALTQQNGVSRIETAQFAVVLSKIREPQDAARVARRMLDQMSTAIMLDGVENYATLNIGIAISPWDGDNSEKLAQASSLALEFARKAGSNRAVFFNKTMNSHVADRLAIEAGLRRALDQGEFVLHYQHRVHGNTGRVLANEALIRWNHPEKGLLYPGAFISIAEESRLILTIGNWVIDEACRQNRAWQAKGFPAIPVAVNVSSVQLSAPGFVQTVKRALDLSGLAPSCLELEITESVVMNDAQLVIERLRELKRIGCKVAIDDFGTGFSSLSYLRDFPADALKIDRSFVTASTKDRKGAAITQAIIELAARLDMLVIAEGIETEEQKNLLLAQGCHDLQGFLFSKPKDATGTEISWQIADKARPVSMQKELA